MTADGIKKSDLTPQDDNWIRVSVLDPNLNGHPGFGSGSVRTIYQKFKENLEKVQYFINFNDLLPF